MSSITEEIFNNLYEKLLSRQKLTDDLIESFIGLFGEQFIDIIPTLDSDYIIKIVSNSGRFLFRVKNLVNRSNTKNPIDYNYCFVIGNYCNCVSFKFDGVSSDKFLWCRHLMAAKIGIAINCYKTSLIDEDEFDSICRCNMLGIY